MTFTLLQLTGMIAELWECGLEFGFVGLLWVEDDGHGLVVDARNDVLNAASRSADRP